MGEDKQTGKLRHWTKEEEHFMQINYGSMTAEQMSLHLNRTITAVHLRSAKLKLKQQIRYKQPPKQGNDVMWRMTPYPGYWITDTGIVWDGRRAVFLNPILMNNGLACVQIRFEKKQIPTSVGRLVWMSFRGEIPSGYVIAYKDRNCYNSDLNNLLLMKHSDMMRFGYSTTRWIVQTDDHGKRIAVYPTIKACAKKFGVSTFTVRDYLKGERIPKKLRGIHLRVINRPKARELRRKKS
ncbi:MAG: hypothetical protein CVU86_07050 [Firmicutes bacterium HGW-Firmicutes-11]|jgi:hypothetical protein|nr:MAG: hypothetical protein CVU94_00755 [Firmicutes bacterium HGW-Firmicutes-19]PKM84482.1 MAG: hypothetical protein CVU86_07050 [Firmicutes bacterium HGW-Firmicutes-11]